MIQKIVADFDGIFSNMMYYNGDGKYMKSFEFGIRHSLELMRTAGFGQIDIITGDSTSYGLQITQKFLKTIKDHVDNVHNVKNHEKLMFMIKHYDTNNIIYVGDDVYDIEAFKLFNHSFSIRHVDSEMHIVKNFYNFVNFAKHIVNNYSDKRTWNQCITDSVKLDIDVLKAKGFKVKINPTIENIGISNAGIIFMFTDKYEVRSIDIKMFNTLNRVFAYSKSHDVYEKICKICSDEHYYNFTLRKL